VWRKKERTGEFMLWLKGRTLLSTFVVEIRYKYINNTGVEGAASASRLFLLSAAVMLVFEKLAEEFADFLFGCEQGFTSSRRDPV